jgi:hypothetical protein
LLISGLPIPVLFLLSGEPALISIGVNLALFLALFVRMLNASFAGNGRASRVAIAACRRK